MLVVDSKSNLRAGDALHLAAAKQFKSKSLATLDKVLAKKDLLLDMIYKKMKSWDFKRLQKYSQGIVSCNLIVDLLPKIAELFFLKKKVYNLK